MIEKITLRDNDDQTAPPSMPCMNIMVIGSDYVFEIVEIEEKHDHRTEKILHTIAISAADFIPALTGLGKNVEYTNELHKRMKERDEQKEQTDTQT